MSPILIVSLIIAGIVVMVIAAFIAQSVENARQERQRKITIYNERIRKISSMLNDIPANYMAPDLRRFMQGLLKQNCNAILELDQRHSAAKAQLKQIEQNEQEAPKADLDSLKTPFNDVITGQGIRARIKDLVNTIVAMNNDKTLDKATAVKFVNQGKMMFELVTIDITLINARKAEQGDSNLKAAAVHYASCFKKIRRINQQGHFNKRAEYIKNHLQQVQAKLKEIEAQQAPEPQEMDEWEKFKQQHQAGGPIKQDYET